MVCSRRASARRQPFSQFGKVPNLLLIFQVCLCHFAPVEFQNLFPARERMHATVRQALGYHAGPPWPSAIWLKHVLATCHAFGLNPSKGWKRIRTVGFNKFDLSTTYVSKHIQYTARRFSLSLHRANHGSFEGIYGSRLNHQEPWLTCYAFQSVSTRPLHLLQGSSSLLLKQCPNWSHSAWHLAKLL